MRRRKFEELPEDDPYNHDGYAQALHVNLYHSCGGARARSLSLRASVSRRIGCHVAFFKKTPIIADMFGSQCVIVGERA